MGICSLVIQTGVAAISAGNPSFRRVWRSICTNNRVLNQPTRQKRPTPRTFPVAGTLVLCFGLICAVLSAIGGVFFFSLHSIESLNAAERSTAQDEIASLQHVSKNLGLRQAGVFRHLATTDPEEKKRHERVLDRVTEANTSVLANYPRFIASDAEKRLYNQVLEARRLYSDRTEELLVLSRDLKNAEAAIFVLTTQAPSFDQYQMALEALLRFEEAEGRGIAAATTNQIEQTRVIGDSLIGLTILIVLGTGLAVGRMVRALGRDKQSLKTEVISHEQAEQALRDGEARYRLLVEHSPDAILVVCDEKIVFLNPAALKLLGADGSDQLVGRSVSKLVHPDEQAEVARRGREVAEGKQPPATERRLIRLDGSTVEVESKVISFLYEGRPALQVIARDNTERAKAERKVRESEANLALAQQVAGVGSWEYQFTADGQVDEGKLLCSQEAYRIFGRSSDEVHLSIEAFYQAIHPDDRAFVLGCFQALRDKDEPFDYDYRIIHPDGAERIIHSVAATVYDPDTGQRSKVVGTVFDITERRVTEKQLHEADEKYRSIFDNALEGIFQTTPDGTILSANPALARMLGFASPEELIREHNSLERESYINQAERQQFKRLIEENGVVSNFEFEVKRKDGSTIWVSENARVVRSAAGDTLYYEGSVQDMTERKRAEQASRESDEKFRQVAENIADVFYITSPDLQQMHYVSPAYGQIWGRSVSDLYAHPQDWSEAILPEDRERALATFARLAADEHSVSVEFRIARPSGEVRWILSRGFQVRDAAGKVIRITGVATDITESKRGEEVLQRSQTLARMAVRLSRMGAWTIEVPSRQLEWSDEMYDILEVSPGEMPPLGQALDLYPPEWRPLIVAALERCAAGGTPFDLELEILTAKGRRLWARAVGAAERDAAGVIRRVQGAFQDISARRQAEEVLAESERRFRFLSDLGDATRSLSKPREIMAAFNRLLGTHLRVSRCAYAEVEKDGDRLTVPGDYTDGCASAVGEFHLADFGSYTHSRLSAGSTVALRDIDTELTPASGAGAFSSLHIKAMIACPLIKNGALRAILAVHSLTPREWTDGEIALVQEVGERCWSIIDHAHAEIVLRESEEHLRLVIAASNDGIWEHNYLTDTLTWSDRMYEMFGLDRRSFVPTVDSLTALIHPDDRAPFQKAVRGQIATGGRYEAHMRILRGDGRYGNFLGRGRVVLDATGKPIRIVGSLADLTSLLQAERKLVEQADLLNLAHDAIMVRDMNDRIEFWNHGAEVLYGWTAEEAQGRLIGDFLSHEEPANILAAQRILIETGAWSGECRHLTKRGDTVVVRSRWTLVRDEHGQPKSKLVINTDITEQKNIEEQFLRAQRLESIGTLASGVAHDLNNVLTPIMMAAPVLRGEMDPVEREKFLDIVETSAQRGADIVKQVLTFARGADGDRTLLQPIYLLEEVSKIASQTFPKSISLRTCYEEDIRLLEADSTQLHQVLLNLCINARDAMPNGGELCLGAENFDVDEQYARMTPGATAGPHVMLQVTDNGSGIPKQVLAKIFDPFFTTKTIGKGTGLGLSTVAGIVKSHGGFIAVDSQPRHTSFKIFLPAKATVDTSSALQANGVIPHGHGETILLVDDEPKICQVAELILKSHGYKVLVAEDGPSAVALFARQIGRIAVVVTDLAMPGMSGLMLVRTLRQIEPELKVIVSTGRADDAHIAEITALRVDACLTKPYTTRSLLLKLSHILQSDLKDAA